MDMPQTGGRWIRDPITGVLTPSTETDGTSISSAIVTDGTVDVAPQPEAAPEGAPDVAPSKGRGK